MDLSGERRPDRDTKRVSVDLPPWLVDALDNEAARLAVTRQSVIEVRLSERVDQNRRALEAEGARRKSQTG